MTRTKTKPPSVRLPKPLSPAEMAAMLGEFDQTPSVFWDHVAATYEWASLRRGGKLLQRVQKLDEHFDSFGADIAVCPLVVFLMARRSGLVELEESPE